MVKTGPVALHHGGCCETIPSKTSNSLIFRHYQHFSLCLSQIIVNNIPLLVFDKRGNVKEKPCTLHIKMVKCFSRMAQNNGLIQQKNRALSPASPEISNSSRTCLCFLSTLSRGSGHTLHQYRYHFGM